ncbi:hypothetical protein G6F46_008518 [Rhizopus delemar]|nr:hypothetical protein G6F55_008366 [Rhizopus delemar]KAG1539279.1 hypothetical protein G6F51_009234 [Rhizopus arrhizus]KAG1493046.1 hypothetical protein G6F54_008868 [Rhizopus delemar]KAG1513737.1 hypothetical protein G6F53_004209 [Rhizopus delemar]KAG1522244.1 hypothetical protein G6F52_006032 [Rhizopus delemar]
MDAFHNTDNPLIQKPCMEPNSRSEAQLSNTDEEIKENWLTKHVLKRQVGKRRKSIGIARPTSMNFVVPRLSKSSIPLQQKKRLDNDYQCDPHIDILDILRAKLSGITRLTQDLHIQELFHSRLLVEKKDMRHLVKCNLRKLYLAEDENSNEQQFVSLVANETVWNNAMSGHENERQEIKTSQNLTSLFMTTNNLLHSKLDEISEVASVNNGSGDLEWKNQFLSLVNICIEQSEKLELLSVDILNAERQVRELLFLNQSLDEQFCKQEKYYEEQIREYQEAANQQKLMTDSLDELVADINTNIESTAEEYKKISRDDIEEVEGMINNKDKVKRWDFSKAVSNLLHMEEKHDIVHKMKWDVGMLVERDIDIGHTLCSFETPLNAIDRMIASSGAITEPVKKIHLNDDQEKGKGEKVRDQR